MVGLSGAKRDDADIFLFFVKEFSGDQVSVESRVVRDDASVDEV